MRKGFSLVLIVVLLFNLFGYYLVSMVEQIMIREQVKERILSTLPDSQLILIREVSGQENGIHWVEHRREFRFGGVMYDVVKSRTERDTTFYYCYTDTRETKLLAHLDRMTREQSDRSKSKINKKPVITYFFQEPPVPSLTCTECDFIFIPIAACKSGFSENLSPPPELSFS